MFQYFNESLWRQIGKEPDDFMEEVRFLKDTNKKVKSFCEPLYNTLKSQPNVLETVLYYRSRRYSL